MAICPPLPNTLVNGTPTDANAVMANFNSIQNGVNTNAAPLDSPALTGSPTAPTPAAADNDTSIATTAFVQGAVTAAVTGFAPLDSPALTGSPTAPTPSPGDNDTSIATTAFVQQAVATAPAVSSFNARTGAVTLMTADVTGVGGALLVSPNFTGTPTAPTAANGTNTTQLATTQFVTNAVVASTTGVASVNGRTGAVVLTSTDITNAGGAPLASPVFTGNPQVPTPAAADNDTSIATTAFVQAAVAPAFNNVGRNLIHNPLFNIAQRGAGPFTIPGGGLAYTLDRWALATTSAETVSVSQVDVADIGRAQIGDEAAHYCWQNVFTGGVGYVQFIQYIEDVRRLSGKTVTVSFWAQSPTALQLGVFLQQNFGSGGSPSALVALPPQTVTLASTWQRFSKTFAMPSTAGKTFGTTAGTAITTLIFGLSAGASFQAAMGVPVQSGTINLWGVQLEIGGVATPLEKPDPRYDLANCQRFYSTNTISLIGYNNAFSPVGQTLFFPVQMRASPTFTSIGGAFTNGSGLVLDNSTPQSFRAYFTATAAGSAALANWTYTATADL